MNIRSFPLNVSDAVSSRFSARAFTSKKVEFETVMSILDRSRFAPSGGNLQPWHVEVLAGPALRGLIDAIAASALRHPAGEPSDYRVYPPNLAEPYRSRRYQCGEDLYAAIGIPREDKLARLQQFGRNLQGFGAPVVLFFSIERFMGMNQWAHLGMFMQTIMLLAREAGLHTCPQEAWSAYSATIREYLDLPEERMFYCGMAMGHADTGHPINQWRTRRAGLEEVARFRGFEQGQE